MPESAPPRTASEEANAKEKENPLESIVVDFEKANKKQKTCARDTLNEVDKLIKLFTEARAKIHANVESQDGENQQQQQHKLALATLANKSKAIATQISDQHKEVNTSISKYSKAVERKFKLDLDKLWNPRALEGKEDVLDKAILLHFIREGKFKIVDTFAEEAKLNDTLSENNLKPQFMEMFTIQESIKTNRNLEPAIQWAKRHKSRLDERESTLEYQLHKLQYVMLLRSQNVEKALEYARQNFPPFVKQHWKELQRLATAILYVHRLAKSPYSDLLAPHLLTDVLHQFTSDFCFLLGLSPESPLFVAVTVGTNAMPTIAKMSAILQARDGLEWTQTGELPVEIPLGPKQRFHSIFTCPVSKEIATEENPPMMLACGHTVVKETLNRLSKGGVARFKCPYCPMEGTAAQAMRIYF